MKDDTISRQAAIEAICKACIMDEDYHECDGYPETSTWCDELVALRALPSAQPEITRCKECRFAHLTYDGDCKHCDKWTDEFGIPEELYLDGNFFCGYAERRTNE